MNAKCIRTGCRNIATAEGVEVPGEGLACSARCAELFREDEWFSAQEGNTDRWISRNTTI